MTSKMTLEEILKGISIQVLETKYTINLGQLLKIIPNITRYIFKLVKIIQSIQPKHVYLKPTCALVAIDHQMAII
jgi:hypothetical protein